jgi:hypothetical protein
MMITTSITLLRDKATDIFDDSATTLKLEDEGGGPFLVIEQYSNAASDMVSLRFDFDELDELVNAWKHLESATKLLENKDD